MRTYKTEVRSIVDFSLDFRGKENEDAVTGRKK